MHDYPFIDPLGRAVRLTDGAWFGHICKVHPEMRLRRHEVAVAIQRPQEIHFSASDRNCRLFYTPAGGSTLTLCVVADVVAGFVKTAYLARRIKPGGKEWP